MLDYRDKDTPSSLKELCAIAKRRDRPIVIWIGAGVSSWCGYPRWADLADETHRDFLHHEPEYNAQAAAECLRNADYPQLFDLCAAASRPRLLGVMASTFKPRDPTAVYDRFVRAIKRISPNFLLTTNFDELLEKHLPYANTVLAQDIERLPLMLGPGEPFVCKLHGTVGDLESLVLTRTQYETVHSQPAFLEHLGRLLSLSHVVFLGYSLQDQHVVGTLLKNESLRRVLAEGPHFLVTPHEGLDAPKSVRRIRYATGPSADHRAALQVLEEIGAAYATVHAAPAPVTPPPIRRTRHLLFDLLPPGTWQTSQTVSADRKDGSKIEMIVGVGLTTEEIGRTPTAMHDLLVGLVCFDEVYAPLSAMDRLFRLSAQTHSGLSWKRTLFALSGGMPKWGSPSPPAKWLLAMWVRSRPSTLT